jgi:hypothetical protein
MTLAIQLLCRWTEVEPLAAIAFAQSLPRLPQRARLVRAALEEWQAADSGAVVKWLSSLPPGRESEQYRQAALELLAAQDPKQALALAGSLDIGPTARARLRASIIEKWAEADPAAAAAAALAVKGLPRDLFGRVAYQWAMADPRAALVWAETLPSREAHSAAFHMALEAWASVDAQAAASYVLGLPDKRRAAMLDPVIKRWALDEPGAVMAWAGAIEDEASRKLVLPSVASACSETDPEVTAPYLQFLSPSVQRRLAPRVVEELLDQDPSLALSFANSLPSGDIQAMSMQVLFNRWAPQDLSSALNALNQLPEGPGRDAALGGLLPEWTKTDPQAAAAYVQGLPAGQQVDRLREVAGYWSSLHPGAAAKWVAGLPEGDARDQAEVQVAVHWGDSSLQAAGDYVAGLPPGKAQDEAVKTLVESAMAGQPDTVREWVGGFPPGPLRDELVSDVAIFWAQAMQDIPGATGWVDKTFGGAYSKIEEDLTGQWLTLDREAARKWVQTSSLPDATKKRLLAP